MKPRIQLAAVLLIAVFSWTSCLKDNSVTPDPDQSNSEEVIQSADQERFTGDMDLIADDINRAFERTPALQGRGNQNICNATVVIDSMSNPRSITINYNGLNCAGTRSLNGQVKVTIPANVRWKDAGAAVTVTITNLKITRVVDGRFITLNGTKTITNVTGGRMMDLPQMQQIIHTITSSNMNVKFDTSSAQRNWNIAKKRTFSFNGHINISTEGMHTIGANNKVVEWGTNRFGAAFITSIEQPITLSSSCNFRIGSGQVQHNMLGRQVSVTFGLNAQGNATTCPGANPYYMRIMYTRPNGQSAVVLRPY